MAGSLDNFVYISDDGVSYVLRCDKSNVVALYPQPPFPTAILPSIPRGLIPRYVLYRSDVAGQTRKIPVLKPSGTTKPTDLPATISGYGIDAAENPTLALVFKKAFYHGERYSFPTIGEDTGVKEKP